MSGFGPPIAVFGGTFDPIHNGHLRSALELAELLGLAEVRMMPCATPPHRIVPASSAGHRAAMLERAVEGEARLRCDRRELERDGLSFTFDSLALMRQELGAQRSISLILGCDAVLGIDTWHRWDELLTLAHIVVIARPGWQLPDRGPLAQWLREHACSAPAQLAGSGAGKILIERLRPLAISASEIREILASGRSARFLLPDSVLDYIESHQLYVNKEGRMHRQIHGHTPGVPHGS